MLHLNCETQDLLGGMCGRWLQHASGLHQSGLGEWQREVRLLSHLVPVEKPLQNGCKTTKKNITKPSKNIKKLLKLQLKSDLW